MGPIRYFAPQPVIDLVGHVNKDIGPFQEAGGTYADYVNEEQVCFLILYDAVENQGIDFAREMGLKDDPRYDLDLQKRFEIPIDIWLLGSEPIRNYMPAVALYSVAWQGANPCSIEDGLE